MKLTKQQREDMWSGGGGPYSQANLIKQVRILDDRVSRIFLVVEVEINPTTFELVEKHRDNELFKDSVVVQQLLNGSEYRGPILGYVAAAFERPYEGVETMFAAEQALQYSQECIIEMHKFVIQLIGENKVNGVSHR